MTHPVSHNPLIRGLFAAALFLGATAALRWLSPTYIDAGLGQRLIGIMMGTLVVVYANALPKTLIPLAALRCRPARDQAVRRFIGIALVSGGVGYILAWIVAPIGVAHVYAMAALGTAFLVAILRCGAASSRRG